MHYSPGVHPIANWSITAMGVSSHSSASQYLSVEQEVTGRVQRILISYYALHNNKSI